MNYDVYNTRVYTVYYIIVYVILLFVMFSYIFRLNIYRHEYSVFGTSEGCHSVTYNVLKTWNIIICKSNNITFKGLFKKIISSWFYIIIKIFSNYNCTKFSLQPNSLTILRKKQMSTT